MWKKKLQSLDSHLKQEKPDETWEKSGFLPDFFFFFFFPKKMLSVYLYSFSLKNSS